MKLYHVPEPDDTTGERTLRLVEAKVAAAGGHLHLSRSFGNGSAVLVVFLPDDVDPAHVNLEDAEHQADIPDEELPTVPVLTPDEDL